MVNELAFVAYSVRDVPRAVAFYRDVLGLTPGESFNAEWIEFELGNATFAIDGSGAGVGMPPGQSTGAAFEVDDIHAMRARLVERNVTAGEVHDFPPCWMCFVQDPDGNRFAIHQRKPKS